MFLVQNSFFSVAVVLLDWHFDGKYFNCWDGIEESKLGEGCGVGVSGGNKSDSDSPRLRDFDEDVEEFEESL